LGFPLLLGDWDFFLKFGLKDNLGFVGLIGEGGLLLVMDYYGLVVFFWLSGVSMGLFVVVLGSLLSLVPLGSHYYGL
jgi:hypothetical protein